MFVTVFVAKTALGSGAMLALQMRQVLLEYVKEDVYMISGTLDFHPKYVDNAMLNLKESPIYWSGLLGDSAAQPQSSP